ncbi:hypothetical protein EWM64_g2684 [Hericium alpestre]|uniref:Uncharacterized protein n=1 Tax=Hericium alpestre TaxID=135208 RepID=A0A4Z0A3M1_9AGAM|nr:hypothetical protein EWM64_g2684 [Hericium alpestre]
MYTEAQRPPNRRILTDTSTCTPHPYISSASHSPESIRRHWGDAHEVEVTISRAQSPATKGIAFKKGEEMGEAEDDGEQIRFRAPVRGRTQEDQDKEDDTARKKAMKELVQSWMDRLQLISLIVRITFTLFIMHLSAGVLLCDVLVSPAAPSLLPMQAWLAHSLFTYLPPSSPSSQHSCSSATREATVAELTAEGFPLASPGAAEAQQPPYASGTLPLSPESFVVYYGASGDSESRRIDLAHADPDELQRLCDACDRATFGLNHEDVLDETYRKAGKMDTSCFSTPIVPERNGLLDIVRANLLEGVDSTRPIQVELYKLNVYIDVEHEVLPVCKGHRVTLTFNLYYADINVEGSASALPLPPSISSIVPPNETTFRDAFKALLENPEFLPNGGILVFGLRHVYPIKKTISHIPKLLKGSDAFVWRVSNELSLDTKLYLQYTNKRRWHGTTRILVPKVPDVKEVNEDFGGLARELQKHYRGIVIMGAGYAVRLDEQMNYVTKLTKLSRVKAEYMAYGNESELECAYGDICIVVRVGKPGLRSNAVKQELKKSRSS